MLHNFVTHGHCLQDWSRSGMLMSSKLIIEELFIICKLSLSSCVPIWIWLIVFKFPYSVVFNRLLSVKLSNTYDFWFLTIPPLVQWSWHWTGDCTERCCSRPWLVPHNVSTWSTLVTILPALIITATRSAWCQGRASVLSFGTIIARHAFIQNLEEYWKSDEQLHLPWDSRSFESNKLTRKTYRRLASALAYCQHAASCRYCQSSVTPVSQFVVSSDKCLRGTAQAGTSWDRYNLFLLVIMLLT